MSRYGRNSPRDYEQSGDIRTAAPRRRFGRLRSTRRRRAFFGVGVAVLIIVVLFVVLAAAQSLSPSFGAWGAETMRAVLGERVTAAVEGFTLSAQDALHRLTYAMGIGHNQGTFATDDSSPTTSATLRRTSTTTAAGTTPTTGSGGPAAGGPSTGGPSTGDSATGGATTTTEIPWQPADVQPMGTIDNEGRWSPYLTDTSGRTVGYRMALQPDPSRGFARAAVVAMDMKYARLHFILGYNEPQSRTPIPRDGKIPPDDRQAGRLLGAFNGGFQAEHGAFGAMANGVEALPAKNGVGTLVIYKDGRVDVGTWGEDITASADMESWRQNGPLMISGGQISKKVGNSDPHVWGFVFGGGVAAWRSGVGVSKDRRTLYFVLGPSLTIESLAATMQRAGVWQGFELDINHAWTRFDKVEVKDGKLVAKGVIGGLAADNRLLNGYKRDFFYVTGN